LERGVGGGEMWLLCGLLIALLFLLIGQVPAILVTSVFFLVLSQLQKWRSSRVGQAGRDQKDVTRRTLEEASRKLHIPSIPGSPVRSPPPTRADINSTEYHKRIIIEGLLERNRKGNI
jgi:nitrogen fixation/metabolism regulation signal transduction histidine kinase